MKRIYFIFLIAILLPLGLHSQTEKAAADSLYAAGKYEAAVKMYETLLEKGDNAYIYYNLGNAYYRMNDLARAILNYERAANREPGDSDIRFNLTLARSKTVDKIDNNEFFLTYWFHSFVNRTNADTWGKWAIILFFISLFLFIGYNFLNKLLFRKLCFYGFCVGLLLVILFNVFAYAQKQKYMDKNHAIVMGKSQVFSTPAESGTALFTLHEGTKVEITDNTMKKWMEIELSDGKTGWIKVSDIEII